MKRKYYKNTDASVAFLLGGIGTGNISIGSRGELRDFEVWGQSGKGNFADTFFCIRYREQDKEPVLKMLEARLNPPYVNSNGYYAHEMAGVPRFEKSRAYFEYPFAHVELIDPAVPLKIKLQAYTPFIPLDEDNSGIPVIRFDYTVKNVSGGPVDVSVCGTMQNFAVIKKFEKVLFRQLERYCDPASEYVEKDGLRGVFMYGEDKSLHNSNGIFTDDRDASVTYKKHWLSAGGWDGNQDFADELRYTGEMTPVSKYVQKDVQQDGKSDMGSLCIRKTLQAGESYTYSFYVTWYIERRKNGWYDSHAQIRELYGDPNGTRPETIRNYYAVKFSDAFDVALYTKRNQKYLYSKTKKFSQIFFRSTLPDDVLNRVAANFTVMRSPTCFRLEDGTFMGWEGCFDEDGSCEGTCTHVWNYAQTLAYLFPKLERSMRDVDFGLEVEESGKQNFRGYKKFGLPPYDHIPAADGQLGTLLRLYREWRFSGDDAFLERNYENAKKSLLFALSYWDKDEDGVIEAEQHNTYDINFYGPNSMINSIFYAALKAFEKMAAYMKDDATAQKCRDVYEKGSKKADAELFNGKYYIQKIDDVDSVRSQYGKGCLSDQIFGQTLAHLNGLGYVFPREHIVSSLKYIYKDNFLTDFNNHYNFQRTYCLNDDQGLILCSWKEEGAKRPKLPFIYSEEVWPGVEYQVATNMIYEGLTEEALTVVGAIEKRYDGYKRNPFDEIECGHHYARSMASYGVYLALTGQQADLVNNTITFAPKVAADHFRCFFSTGTSWGEYTRRIEDGKVKEERKIFFGKDQCDLVSEQK